MAYRLQTSNALTLQQTHQLAASQLYTLTNCFVTLILMSLILMSLILNEPGRVPGYQ
jgi:hypothetical protein